MNYRSDIRNIALIAHVDHGKTTLVDAMLKQSKVFRNNQMVGELIMDQNALEREKGITIMAKNTAVVYQGVKINIIDTPGHADFSGEVERVVSMADGCLLLVDSIEGPMPQTKFVLRLAMEMGLNPIVVINKVDRRNSRIAEVLQLTEDLFLELAISADQLDFPVLYASAREGTVVTELGMKGKDVTPLLECILGKVPPPKIESGSFQMLVSNLAHDSHKGKIAIGRIWRGKVAPHQPVVNLGADGSVTHYEINEVFTYLGLKHLKVEEAEAGRRLLEQLGLRELGGLDLIACPSCGRAEVDVIALATEAQRRLEEEDLSIRVAIMGCVVNGPGEAREADIGIAAGKGKGHLFIKGRVVRVVPEEGMIDALLEEARRLVAEGAESRLAVADAGAEEEAAAEAARVLAEQGDANRTAERRAAVT